MIYPLEFPITSFLCHLREHPTTCKLKYPPRSKSFLKIKSICEAKEKEYHKSYDAEIRRQKNATKSDAEIRQQKNTTEFDAEIRQQKNTTKSNVFHSSTSHDQNTEKSPKYFIDYSLLESFVNWECASWQYRRMAIVIGYENNGMFHANELFFRQPCSVANFLEIFDLEIDGILHNSVTYSEFGQKAIILGWCHCHWNHGSWYNKNDSQGLKLYDLDIALQQKMEKKFPDAIVIIIDREQTDGPLAAVRRPCRIGHENGFQADNIGRIFEIYQLTEIGRSEALTVLKLPMRSTKNDFCHKTDSHHYSYYQKVSKEVKITYSMKIHLSTSGELRPVTTPALFDKERYAKQTIMSLSSTEIVDVQCKNCMKVFQNNR